MKNTPRERSGERKRYAEVPEPADEVREENLDVLRISRIWNNNSIARQLPFETPDEPFVNVNSDKRRKILLTNRN